MDYWEYYSYLWIREFDGTFPAGTPYYAGKGKGDRAFTDHEPLRVPKNPENIIVEYHPSAQEAFDVEIFFISYFGRIDLGTGCLRNLTCGGEGTYEVSPLTKRKISFSRQGIEFSPAHIQNLSLAHKGIMLGAIAKWSKPGEKERQSAITKQQMKGNRSLADYYENVMTKEEKDEATRKANISRKKNFDKREQAKEKLYNEAINNPAFIHFTDGFAKSFCQKSKSSAEHKLAFRDEVVFAYSAWKAALAYELSSTMKELT